MAKTFPTKAEFVAHLALLLPDDFAGEPGDACACPLARYLKVRGAEWPEVTAHAWRRDYSSDEDFHQLPPWACKFVATIDGLDDDSNVLTAHQCLEILR